MNSNMVKPEKVDHIHLVYHFTIPWGDEKCWDGSFGNCVGILSCVLICQKEETELVFTLIFLFFKRHEPLQLLTFYHPHYH